MKSFKMLMMVALTILSVSLFAQDFSRTSEELKISEQKSAKDKLFLPNGFHYSNGQG